MAKATPADDPKSLTVAELVAQLSKLPQHLPIVVMDGSSEGYGEDIGIVKHLFAPRCAGNVTEVVHDEDELPDAVYLVVGSID